MLAVSECPPANRLQKLALGLLDEADAESLSSHVLECNRCGVTLAEFQGSDTLADALHQAARTTESIPHGPVAPPSGISARNLRTPSFTSGKGMGLLNSPLT